MISLSALPWMDGSCFEWIVKVLPSLQNNWCLLARLNLMVSLAILAWTVVHVFDWPVAVEIESDKVRSPLIESAAGDMSIRSSRDCTVESLVGEVKMEAFEEIRLKSLQNAVRSVQSLESWPQWSYFVYCCLLDISDIISGLPVSKCPSDWGDGGVCLPIREVVLCWA